LTAFGSFDQNGTVTDALVADAFASPEDLLPDNGNGIEKVFFPVLDMWGTHDGGIKFLYAKASATNASVTVLFWSKLPKAVKAGTDTLKSPSSHTRHSASTLATPCSGRMRMGRPPRL